jgi:hypothetical protein
MMGKTTMEVLVRVKIEYLALIFPERGVQVLVRGGKGADCRRWVISRMSRVDVTMSSFVTAKCDIFSIISIMSSIELINPKAESVRRAAALQVRFNPPLYTAI